MHAMSGSANGPVFRAFRSIGDEGLRTERVGLWIVARPTRPCSSHRCFTEFYSFGIVHAHVDTFSGQNTCPYFVGFNLCSRLDVCVHECVHRVLKKKKEGGEGLKAHAVREMI